MPDETTTPAAPALADAPGVACTQAAQAPSWQARLHRLKSWLTHSTDENASRLELTAYSVGGIGQGLTGGSIEQLIMPILNMTHFDSTLGGAQTEQTFFTMRILFSIAPACANALVLFLLYKYPLTATRMEEIRSELQRRRAAKLEAAPL